ADEHADQSRDDRDGDHPRHASPPSPAVPAAGAIGASLRLAATGRLIGARSPTGRPTQPSSRPRSQTGIDGSPGTVGRLTGSARSPAALAIASPRSAR